MRRILHNFRCKPAAAKTRVQKHEDKAFHLGTNLPNVFHQWPSDPDRLAEKKPSRRATSMESAEVFDEHELREPSDTSMASTERENRRQVGAVGKRA